MINKILDGISIALDAAFGYNIYSETVKQDFEEPCFFIMPLTFSDVQQVGLKGRKQTSFNVQYFPQSEEPNGEILTVYEGLYQALRTIETEIGLLRGTGIKGETVDGVLHFFVDYNINTVEHTTKENMENVKINSKIGGYDGR